MTSTLFTSVMSVESANTAKKTVYLFVMNASGQPRSGTLEIISLDTKVMSAASYNSVAPGGGTGIDLTQFLNQPVSITQLYGQITVDSTPDSIRASLVLLDAQGNAEISLPAY